MAEKVRLWHSRFRYPWAVYSAGCGPGNLSNPARLVKNPRGRERLPGATKPTLRFGGEEVQRMYEARASRYGKQAIKWSRVFHSHRVEGEYARYQRDSESGNQIRGWGYYGQVQSNPSRKGGDFGHAPATFPADEYLHLAGADRNHMS